MSSTIERELKAKRAKQLSVLAGIYEKYIVSLSTDIKGLKETQACLAQVVQDEQEQERLHQERLNILEQDIDAKMEQYFRDQNSQKKRLLFEEKDRILELVAAHKYRSSLEGKVQSFEKNAIDAKIIAEGLQNLCKAIDLLTETAQSYSLGGSATSNKKKSAAELHEATEKKAFLEKRKHIIEERKAQLEEYQETHVNLTAALAMEGLLEHLQAYTTTEI